MFLLVVDVLFFAFLLPLGGGLDFLLLLFLFAFDVLVLVVNVAPEVFEGGVFVLLFVLQ